MPTPMEEGMAFTTVSCAFCRNGKTILKCGKGLNEVLESSQTAPVSLAFGTWGYVKTSLELLQLCKLSYTGRFYSCCGSLSNGENVHALVGPIPKTSIRSDELCVRLCTGAAPQSLTLWTALLAEPLFLFCHASFPSNLTSHIHVLVIAIESEAELIN